MSTFTRKNKKKWKLKIAVKREKIQYKRKKAAKAVVKLAVEQNNQFVIYAIDNLLNQCLPTVLQPKKKFKPLNTFFYCKILMPDANFAQRKDSQKEKHC